VLNRHEAFEHEVRLSEVVPAGYFSRRIIEDRGCRQRPFWLKKGKRGNWHCIFVVRSIPVTPIRPDFRRSRHSHLGVGIQNRCIRSD
jgi:hypothetical protein